jgi:hypothetical protein
MGRGWQDPDAQESGERIQAIPAKGFGEIPCESGEAHETAIVQFCEKSWLCGSILPSPCVSTFHLITGKCDSNSGAPVV